MCKLVTPRYRPAISGGRKSESGLLNCLPVAAYNLLAMSAQLFCGSATTNGSKTGIVCVAAKIANTGFPPCVSRLDVTATLG